MAAKYKLWLNIEEIDEDEDIYRDVESEEISIGPEFDTLEKAQSLKERLLNMVTDDGEVAWVPPITDVAQDRNRNPLCGRNSCINWEKMIDDSKI